MGPSVPGQSGRYPLPDDFLLFDSSESLQCAVESLSRALTCCDLIWVPVAPAKMEVPPTKLASYSILAVLSSQAQQLVQHMLRFREKARARARCVKGLHHKVWLNTSFALTSSGRSTSPHVEWVMSNGQHGKERTAGVLMLDAL